ncbi:MAG: phosphatidate cytidylyltransferase [Planctomycetia bacterium]|nr:phosphatidate cytidylyltransferase [Planctomycetia bacterium]
MDYRTLWLLLIILPLMTGATVVAYWLKKQTQELSGTDPILLEKFYSRLKAWWLLYTLVAAAALLSKGVIVFLFCCMSFWAMREFITLTPTRAADHKTLFLLFFITIPLQYIFVGWGMYEIYSIFIPVYVFLLIPVLIAASGDTKRFLERIAKISFGFLICVYCLSYAPALMTLSLNSVEMTDVTRETEPNISSGENIETEPYKQENLVLGSHDHNNVEPKGISAEGGAAESGETAEEGFIGENNSFQNNLDEDSEKITSEQNFKKQRLRVSSAGLLCFLILMTQLTEIFQYASLHFWPNQHIIAPAINSSKTWEGMIISSLGVMFIGALLYWATPFSFGVAGLMSLVIAVMSFGGSLTLSAIKRDRGVDDYGTLVAGHGGILDRIDTICFAAPIFFHLTQIYLHFYPSFSPQTELQISVLARFMSG